MEVISPKINRVLKYQLIILVGIFIVLEGFLIYHLIGAINYIQRPEAIKQENDKTLTELIRRRIDGMEVDKGLENLYPTAVNIDNHFDSWPNFGLTRANLVYETLVEGNATRFLAFYTPVKDNENLISKIGPVRSTRPYFVEIAKEYNALLAHSGGSPDALELIKKLGVSSLEEIAWWGPDYYWRVYSRSTPHNLFTSNKNLAQGVIDWELNGIKPNYKAWKFNENVNFNNLPKANNIKIDFSEGTTFDVSYEYSSSTQTYLRFQGDNEHIDGLNNQQIEVNNLIIQFTDKEKILDEVGRIELNLIGKGEALIFRDGVKINGSWKKMAIESKTVFYDEDGNEIEFKPGNVWIEIVPVNREVEIW